MKFFTKNEFRVVAVILIVIFVASFVNLRIALRRARDVSRRGDLRAVQNALLTYKEANGFFPPSSDDGRIVACPGDEYESFRAKNDPKVTSMNDYIAKFRPCDWGKDKFADIVNEPFETFMGTLPIDPRFGEGYSFRYISTGTHFQLFVYLEGEEDDEQFQKEVQDRNLMCGLHVCNFGYASERTPLDKSLEEYENELREQELMKQQ